MQTLTALKNPTEIIEPVVMACCPKSRFERECYRTGNPSIAAKNLLLESMKRDGFGIHHFDEFPFIGSAIEYYLSLVDWESIAKKLVNEYKLTEPLSYEIPVPDNLTQKFTAQIRRHINHDCKCFLYETERGGLEWDEEFVLFLQELLDRVGKEKLAREYITNELRKEGYLEFPDYPFVENAIAEYEKYVDWTSLGIWLSKKVLGA